MTEVPPPFEASWFLALLGFFVGAALGSFMTMLSYRLPRRLSITHPRSSCPTCKVQLAARDLVPIFSWMVSGGHCRFCQKKISKRYPLIEVVSASLSAILFVAVGFTPLLIPCLFVLVALLTLAIIQFEQSMKD